MRLLKYDSTGRITLTEDLPDDQRPKYAILSHTWSPAGSRDEVSFDDVTGGVGLEKPGYEKIRFCARQARQDGLDHFWVDTCCIDKKDAVELSRSLISMYRWYAEAERCYAYLSDVPQTHAEGDKNAEEYWLDDFRVSRWFKRGWTLQELLAPSKVEFFSRDGCSLGTKRSLQTHISTITHIPVHALSGQTLSDFTVQERLQWQEDRETREPEDLVYSMFGIFNVSLPVLYGEGRAQARERLLDSIETTQKGARHKDFSVTFSLDKVIETRRFVAREEELREIREELRSNGRRQYVVLQGLGGIGKTQLAVAYALRHVEDYSAIFWLNATDGTSVKSSFARIAKRILREHPFAAGLAGLDAQQSLDRTVEAVKAWLSMRMNTRWLMVYDNYDNPAIPENSDLAALDLRDYLPEAHQGSVIITTRSSLVRLGHCIHIEKLKNLQDGLKILEHTSGRGCLTNDPGAERLARKLDGLPLALATAGAYLSQTAVSFLEYLDFFDHSWARLQQLTPRLSTYEDRTLFSTWQISFDQVKQRNILSANLLRWWAYFGNQDLWFELLNHWFRGDYEWMRRLTRDKLEFQATLQVLCQHGLAETAPDSEFKVESRGYSIHGCVHSWTITVLNARKDDALAISALQRVALHAPIEESVNSPLIQRRLLGHANQCLRYDHGRFHDKEDPSFGYHNLGLLYANQGKTTEAEEMYQRALQGYEKAFGPDYPSTLDTINNLGVLYERKGKTTRAEEMYQRALQGKEKAFGPNHPSTLNTVNNLGCLYEHQGKTAEAEEMYQRALRGKEKALGPDHPSTLDTVNNLGVLYEHQGKTAEAEEMYQRALRGKEKAFGPDHPSTLRTVNNLGVLYRRQGKTTEAEEMYQRALRGKEKAFGPNHPSTLNTVNNLGVLNAEQGKTAEAEEMYQRALQGKEKAFGPDHPSALSIVNNLGTLYAEQGKTTKAEEMYQRALQGKEKALGPDHPSTLNTVNNLGCLYAKQGKLAEAEKMYQRAFDGYTRMPPRLQAFVDRLGRELSNARPKPPGSQRHGSRKLVHLLKH